MLPSALCRLSVSVEAERIAPRYFTPRDLPWLQALFQIYAAFVGRKQRALRERLQEPVAPRVALAKLRIASHVLDAASKGRVSACVPPREARWALFRAAALVRESREQTLGQVAAALGVSTEALEAALFADLEGERCVAALPSELSPEGFLPIVNQAIVGSWLRRALRVRVRAFTHAAALVQRARELGLICSVEPIAEPLADDAADAATLRISGPFTLFRRTQVYGRALAALLPAMARCERFEAEVSCAMDMGQRPLRLTLSSADPIRAPQAEPTSVSQVHERFIRDFRLAAPSWELTRLSPLSRRDGTAALADFELLHRSDPTRRWQLEVLGFWTEEHLRQRLRRAVGSEARTLLCIDEARSCDLAEPIAEPRCLRFKTRIDVARVLAVIEGDLAASGEQ